MLYTDRYTVEGPGLSNFSFPADRALLVVGDSHGQVDALRNMLSRMGAMPTPGKHRVLVFTGDFIDRGPDSLGCLTVALLEGKDLAAADEVVFLPGNHELLLADTLEDMEGDRETALRSMSGQTWLRNGGMAFLLEGFEAAGREMPKDMVEATKAFGEMLPHPGHDSFAAMVRSWPSHYRMGDALCVHAGLYPTKPQAFTLDLDQRSHMPGNHADTGAHKRHWAWVREPFLEWQNGWPEDGEKLDKATGRGCLVFHGHTVPAKARSSALEHGDDVRKIFCRMTSSARVCVDGGAAAGVGVAGAMLTDAGMRVLFSPC
jgi:serine/threonine protein phosphatase 1